MANNKLTPICARHELNNTRFITRNIHYKKQLTSAIVFVFDGNAYAYINDCMHMHRRLNCEEDAIFDETGQYLRCSMHGFDFDPITGECQSPVCLGERLQALRLQEIDGVLYFSEKHLALID